MKITINNFLGGVDAKTSDNLLGLFKSKICSNVQFSSGAVEAEGVFRAQICGLPAPSGLLDSLLMEQSGGCGGRVILYKKRNNTTFDMEYKLVIFDQSNTGFYLSLPLNETSTLEPLGVKFNSAPSAINYNLNGEDVLIMVAKDDNMVVWDGESAPEVVIDAPLISSMAVHYERLFATSLTDPFKLWFSDDLDPTNWSISENDAGFINMLDERGPLKKVVSFNDYLYVFREKGISRVYANTVMQSNFYVNHLFTAGGFIYDKTIAICGDKMFFVADDGIYTFDGSSASRRLEGLFPLLGGLENASAVYHSGKYFLACKVNFDYLSKLGLDENIKNGQTNNAIVVIDGENYSYNIYSGMLPLDIVEVSDGTKGSLLVLNDSSENPIVEFVPNKDIEEDNANVGGVLVSGLYKVNQNKTMDVVRKVSASVQGGATIYFYNELLEVSSPLEFCDGYQTQSILFSGQKIGYIVVLKKAKDKLERLAIEVV